MSALDFWICFSAALLLLLANRDLRLLQAREEAGRERDRADRAGKAVAGLYREVDALHRELELAERTDPLFARIVGQINREDRQRGEGVAILDDYRPDELGGDAA